MHKCYLFIAIFCLCLASYSSRAHNTQVASFKLVLNAENSYIDIHLSQYGAEQGLLKSNPEIDLNNLSSTMLKELLIRHLKSTIQLNIDGKTVTLGKGLIKLGNHDSKLRFKLTNVGTQSNLVSAKINSFDANKGQVNIVHIAYKDTKLRQILSSDNSYQHQFVLN